MNGQDIYYAVSVKGQFWKIKYQNIFTVIYFPLLCLHRLVITFSHESSPRPREELRPLGAPTTVPPPPRPVNRRTAALFTDMEKFLCQKKKIKKKKWMKQIKLHVIPHHLPLHQ